MRYSITKPAQTIRNVDGSVFRQEPEETRTFRTGAEMLHWAIKEDVFDNWRQRRRPVHFSDPYLGHDRPGGTYGVFDSFTRWRFQPEHVVAMRRAQERYNAILHYFREVEPEWRPDVESTGNAEGRVCYADNSEEIHEINKYGQRRHRMAVAPHGDVCF